MLEVEALALPTYEGGNPASSVPDATAVSVHPSEGTRWRAAERMATRAFSEDDVDDDEEKEDRRVRHVVEGEDGAVAATARAPLPWSEATMEK